MALLGIFQIHCCWPWAHPPHSRMFLQAVLLSTKWESPVRVHPSGTPGWRKGIFVEKSVGSQRGFAGAYDGLVHPHGRWCYSVLGEWPQMVRALGCWLARSLPVIASPLPLDEMADQLRPRLLRNGSSFWTAVFIFSQCMCLILCWSCKREGPRCVAKFFWWGCTRHSANSTYRC